MKRLPTVSQILKNDSMTKKISIYGSTKVAGEDFDPYEKNYSYVNTQPFTLRGIVRELTAESLVWRQMGTALLGAVEVICDLRYENWFKIANKVVIDGSNYQVYKEAVGNNVMIQKRPCKLMRVILQRKVTE